MGKWDGLNRRKFPRVNYPCLVIIHLGNEKEKETLLTHTENIGIGGVGVILKRQLKMFCPVEIELDLMDLKEHIKCKGRVVWVVQRKKESSHKPLFYDVGIEFMNLGRKDYERIEAVIGRLVRNQRMEVKTEVLK